MAQAVVMAAVAAGKISGTAAVFAATTAAALTDLAITSAYQKKKAADARKDAASAPRDVTIRSAVEPARIIYGKARTSGPVVYTNTQPTPGTNDNSTLWTAISLANHECESIEEIWLDGDQILWSQLSGTGGVTSGKYGPINTNEVTNFYAKLGTPSQTALTELVSAFNDWTSAYTGQDITYLVSAFELGTATGEGVWSQGAPQNIRAVVKGKKVYDPRKDSTTATGSGSHRLNDPTTWEWSDNPALCLADYLFDDRLGLGAEGVTYNDIDWLMVANAAAACDVTVTTPGGNEKRFTCNGVLSTGATYADNIRTLVSSMNGMLTWSGGKYRIRACAYEAPTYSFTEDDIVGDVQVQPERTRSQRFNTIRGTYIDPESDYNSTEFIPVTNSNYQNTRDKGQKLVTDISLPMTNSEYMAQRLAYKSLNLNNQQTTAVLPLNWKALKVGVGDRIRVSVSELSWSNKIFVVENWSFEPDKGFVLNIKEDSSSAYADPGLSDYSTRTSAGVVTFADQLVSAPSGLQATAEEEAVLLEWEAPPRGSGYDEVVIYASEDSDWANAIEVGRTRSTVFRHELLRGLQRYYWIRSVDVDGEFSIRDPDSDTSTIQATAGAGVAVIGGVSDTTIVDVNGNPVTDQDLLNEYNVGKSIALLLNKATDGTVNLGEGSLVGVDNEGNPALNTDGFFIFDGVKYTVPRNQYLTATQGFTFLTIASGKRGYLVYDTKPDANPSQSSSFTVSNTSVQAAFVWKDGTTWYYDDNLSGTGTSFTPDVYHLVLGYINTGTSDFIVRGGLIAEPVQLIAFSEINADHIIAGTIDASVVNVTNLNADEINTGTLDASTITVTNLDADSINTGSLDADFINIDGVTLDTDGAGTLIIKNGGVGTDQIAVDAITSDRIEEGAVKGKTIALLLNQNSDGTANSGEGSLVGVNNLGSAALNTDGFFIFNGTKYTVSRNQFSSVTFATQVVNKKGYLAYDLSGANFSIAQGASRAAFVWKESGQWYYDDNSASPAVAFTPGTDILALAFVETSSPADANLRGGLLAEPVQLSSISEIVADYISAGTIDASLVTIDNLTAQSIDGDISTFVTFSDTSSQTVIEDDGETVIQTFLLPGNSLGLQPIIIATAYFNYNTAMDQNGKLVFRVRQGFNSTTGTTVSTLIIHTRLESGVIESGSINIVGVDSTKTANQYYSITVDVDSGNISDGATFSNVRGVVIGGR